MVKADVDSVHLIGRDREQIREDGRRLLSTFLRNRTDMFQPEISMGDVRQMAFRRAMNKSSALRCEVLGRSFAEVLTRYGTV